MLQGIENVFQEREYLTSKLSKKSYPKKMGAFEEEYKDYFVEMSRIMQNATEKEMTAKEIAVQFVEAVKKKYTGRFGKIKPVIQVNMNMIMVYYVFPMIMRYVEDGELLSVCLRDTWNSTFPKTEIQCSDYEMIFQSFRETWLGIPINNK